MKTSDILNRAAEIMMERGHTKGEFVDDRGRVCLLGACQAALCERLGVSDATHYYDPTLTALEDVVYPHKVEAWNDRPMTTEAMAIGVLLEAAIIAKGQDG